VKKLLLAAALVASSTAYAGGAKTLPRSYKLSSLTGGTTVGPKELKGKVTVLQFFAAWCVGCGPVMGEIAPLVEGNDGAKFVPVSVDETAGEAVAYFKRQTAAVKPLVRLATHDKDAKLASALRIEALPAVVVVDGEGKVLTSYVGHPDAAFVQKVKKLVGAAH